MNVISDLLDALRDTEEVTERLRRAAEDRPDDEVLRINAASIAKRRGDLVRRLNKQLTLEQHDFVDYRIERLGGYPALAVARSIAAFQELVTAIFDALRSANPKLRYRPSPESVLLSTLDFSSARMGSAVVSLHIPNERMLLAESDLDVTVDRLFQLLSSRGQSEFRDIVGVVGVASISKAFVWADVSVSFGLSTSISWGKTTTELKEIRISHGEAVLIKEAIEATSTEDESEYAYDGVLEGIDPVASYFHFVLGDGTVVKGDTAEIPRAEWTTAKRYRARLRRRVVIKFATGEEKETWTLLGLNESDQSA